MIRCGLELSTIPQRRTEASRRSQRSSVAFPYAALRAALVAFTILLLLSVFPACTLHRNEPAPKAVGGVIDLSGWNFARNGPLGLAGTWAFYWDRLLSPADFAGNAHPAKSSFIAVPDNWDSLKIGGKKLGNKGFATYRLKIDGLSSETPLALEMPQIDTAATVWVNGKQLYRSGVVGKSAPEAIPRWTSTVVPFPTRQRHADVVVQVSSFRFRSAGIEGGFILGERSDLLGHRDQDLFLLVLITGGMLVMGLYHLVLFLVRRRETAPLYLGIVFLAQFLFQLSEGREFFLSSALPNLSWAFLYKLMLFTYYITMACTVLFIRSTYPHESSRWFTALHVSVSGLFILATGVLSARLSSFLEPVYDGISMVTIAYLTFVLILAAVHGRQGARIMVCGMTILFAAVAHDILGDYGLASSADFVLLGEFVVLITQSFLLATRFSAAFSTVERQEAALKGANVELEAKVHERTASLEKSVREKDALLREVHHRVKNNMQVIVSLLNLQSDNLKDRAAIRALEEGRDRIRSMMLIHENLYLSDDLAMIDFGDYAERIVSEIFFSYGVKPAKIDYAINGRGVALDLDRAVPCGLVLNELATNAIKYAFPGDRTGRFSIDLIREDSEGYTLTIADNGIGLPADANLHAGSTLGLRLVRGLVKRQLGGEIAISTRSGTVFTIRFGAYNGGK